MKIFNDQIIQSCRQAGFTSIQIVLLTVAGIIVLSGVLGGVFYFSKPSSEIISGKCGDGICDPGEEIRHNFCLADCENKTEEIKKDIPYYFIAIHNEPFHGTENQELLIGESYDVLKKMIEKADQYNIKLTLMFSVPWAEYVSQSNERIKDLESWKKSGHEIAAHHHGLGHGNWDGYTDSSQKEAILKRQKMAKNPEPYLGNLNEYVNKLKTINSDIKSGCVNDEDDKKELPDQIIYDTCSGFANYGEVGTREGDNVAGTKGVNEYISVGVWNGITRKWLTHFQANSKEREPKAENVFGAMKADVYGVVFHSIDKEKQYYDMYLEFLHSQDSRGEKSKTVGQIIEQKLLPEKTLSSDLINKEYGPVLNNINNKCGDGVCDALEKANSNLCPGDCYGY